MATELHREGKKKHRPWTLLHMDNARPHTSKRNSARLDELRPKRIVHLPLDHEIALSDFFLFGLLKSELSSRSVGEIGELFEIVDEILSSLRPDTIVMVFANSIERMKQVMITNGDYIWCLI
jgi:hypothetical protein